MVLHLGNNMQHCNTVISDGFHEPSPSNSSQCGSTCRPVVCCTCTWRCMHDRTGPVAAEWRIPAAGAEIHTACRNAVCLEVWNTNASCKLVRYVLCVSLPCPHSCNKWCLKTWHSTKADITMKELGLFLYQTCGHIGDGLWQFMARFTRFCVVSLHVPTRPSQLLPQDPVRAAEWLQARMPRSQHWKKATLRVQTCILMWGSIPTYFCLIAGGFWCMA